jgi:metal-responsive CopG/Arc/MetJ family transcriptional regulator
MRRKPKIRIEAMISEETLIRLNERWINKEPELSRSQLIEKAVRRYLDEMDSLRRYAAKAYK